MTWEELGILISSFSKSEKKKPVQVIEISPNGDHVNECKPAIAFDTIDKLQIYACRSVVDNERHGEDFVLLIDGNPHAECGAIAWEWTGEGFDNPTYGPYGKTDPAKQRASGMADIVRDVPNYVLRTVASRIKEDLG